jgi:hypothetical protein
MPGIGACERELAACKQNRIAYAVSRAAVNLPSALSLEQEDVRPICSELKPVLAMNQASA